MGNDEPEVQVHYQPPVRPIEVKTYLMTCQNKLSLYRNKKIYEIKKKKEEIISALKQNNIDIAKSKMESIMQLEDLIVVYDILGPLCEILKERVNYLLTSQQPPADIRAQLDTLIYASARIELEDLYKLRYLVQRKYGIYYIQAADQNRDGLVNVNVVEKLRVKPTSSVFLTIRLKQLCKEKKFNYDFPEEFTGNDNNPYDGMGNPYDSNFGNNMGGGNPYNANNFGNPYDLNNNMGGNQNTGNDFDMYMKKSGNNNMNNFGNNINNNLNNNFGGNPYDNNFGNNPYNTGGNPYANNNMNNYNNNMKNSNMGKSNTFQKNNNNEEFFPSPFMSNNNTPGFNNNNFGENDSLANPFNNGSKMGGSKFGGNNPGSSQFRPNTSNIAKSKMGQSQMNNNNIESGSQIKGSQMNNSKMGNSQMKQSKVK